MNGEKSVVDVRDILAELGIPFERWEAYNAAVSEEGGSGGESGDPDGSCIRNVG